MPAPVTQGGRGDAKQKPPQVAGLQLRDGAAEERQLFLLISLPRACTHPLRRQRCRESEGTTPGCSLLPGNMGFKSPVLGGGHGKFGCQSLSKGVFGEEGTAKTGLEAGERGASR